MERCGGGGRTFVPAARHPVEAAGDGEPGFTERDVIGRHEILGIATAMLER